jgi:hypothetical protein
LYLCDIKLQLAAAAEASLKATIASLSDQIEALKEQLAAALKDNKDVVAKALEASSKEQAFQALKSTIDTQNTGGSSRK